MVNYEVNEAAMDQARKLIRSGRYDTDTEWSEAAPSTDEANREIERHGYEGYGGWHLGIDTEASEETKGRFGFPYGDFNRVNRAALIHAKQRASQNDHGAVEKAADELLRQIDDEEG